MDVSEKLLEMAVDEECVQTIAGKGREQVRFLQRIKARGPEIKTTSGDQQIILVMKIIIISYDREKITHQTRPSDQLQIEHDITHEGKQSVNGDTDIQ